MKKKKTKNWFQFLWKLFHSKKEKTTPVPKNDPGFLPEKPDSEG